jgi:hypothetical protein
MRKLFRVGNGLSPFMNEIEIVKQGKRHPPPSNKRIMGYYLLTTSEYFFYKRLPYAFYALGILQIGLIDNKSGSRIMDALLGKLKSNRGVGI